MSGPDDFADAFAGAGARADQHMALLREHGMAVIEFSRAAQELDATLLAAGMGKNERTTALVQIALAVGLTSE